MARRLFEAQLLLAADGNPVPFGQWRAFTDYQAGEQVLDLVAADGSTPLDMVGEYFVAGPDGVAPYFRGPDTGDGATETVQLFIDTGAGPRYVVNSVDAQRETMMATQTVLEYISQGGGGGGGAGLPVGTTLENIPNGATRLAFTQAERDKLTTLQNLRLGTTADTAKRGDYKPTTAEVGAVANVTGVSRMWGRTVATGLPTAAEGALDGDYALVDRA